MSCFETTLQHLYRYGPEHSHSLLDDRNQRLAAILTPPGPLGPNHPAHRPPHPAESPSHSIGTPLLALPTELHLEIFSYIRAGEDAYEAQHRIDRNPYGTYYDEDGDVEEDGGAEVDILNHVDHVHQAYSHSGDRFRDLARIQNDEKHKLPVNTNGEPQAWLWTVLALRGTSRFFRHLLPPLTHMELLQLEVTLRAASRTLQACRYCLRLRAAHHFSRTQNKRYRVPLDALLAGSHMGFKSLGKRGKRMCLDCGFAQAINPSTEIEKSRYSRGADVIVDKLDGHSERWVWCWWCGVLKRGDDAGKLAASCTAGKAAEVKVACSGSCLMCCISHGCTGACVIEEQKRRRAVVAAEMEEKKRYDCGWST